MDQAFQFASKGGAAVFGQIEEAKGLEASFGGPHGEHHLGAAADAGRSDMEEDRHADPFVERVIDGDQASVEGELIHAAADLASILQHYQREDRTTEFDARIPLTF